MYFRTFVRRVRSTTRNVVRPFALLLVLHLPLGESSAGDWTDPSGRQWNLEPVPGEWLVRFLPGSTPEVVQEFRSRPGHEVLREFGPRTRTAILRTTPADAGTLGSLAAPDVVESVAPVYVDEEGFRKYLLPGRLTVQFTSDLAPLDAEAQIEAAGSSILRRYQNRGYYQISTPSPVPPPREGEAGAGSPIDGPLEPVFRALRFWSARPDVRFAEPVYLGFDDALMETPNDPYFLNQWALRNPGTGAWRETADVWADAAWWISRGSPDVVIAFVDTGMDMAHEDLAPNLLPQYDEDWDFVDPDPVPQDTNNHGTLVTGIASAVQGNGIGVSGFAPHCPVMPLRVSLIEGEIAERVDAIQYCAARRPEFAGLIVNCSWGNSSGDFTSVRVAIQDAVEAGCVVVCAAGNSNSNVIYPARYPETIAVGATSPCDERKRPGSCDGEAWGSCFGPELDVVAPGVRIWTTDRTGNLGLSTTNYWGFFNGTSAAAPFVTALAALVQSVAPGLSPAEIQDVIERGSDDEVGFPPEDIPGFDVYMGWGRINGWKALVLATHPDGILDDIESPDPFWRHGTVAGAGPDTWHVTDLDNRTDGGSQCWSNGEEGAGSYLPGMDAALFLPDLWVPEDGELVFWHRMDAFELTPAIAGDGGFLEASADGGVTWSMLEPEGGYSHTLGSLSGDPYPYGQAVFSGSFGWRRETVDLSSWAGAPIRIRFRFGSRSDAQTEDLAAGWRIDDVSVDSRDVASLLPGAFPVPSPIVLESLPAIYSQGKRLRFALTTPAEVRLSVFSATGRRHGEKGLGDLGAGVHEVDLDGFLSHAPSGSYWVRLHSAVGIASGRIVVVG